MHHFSYGASQTKNLDFPKKKSCAKMEQDCFCSTNCYTYRKTMTNFAVALCWDNIQLNAAEIFCIVQGRSILLPGHCIQQILWLGIIICKNKKLNTGQYITEGHSFTKFQDHLFLISDSHFCRKKREQNYQPRCSNASTS